MSYVFGPVAKPEEEAPVPAAPTVPAPTPPAVINNYYYYNSSHSHGHSHNMNITYNTYNIYGPTAAVTVYDAVQPVQHSYSPDHTHRENQDHSGRFRRESESASRPKTQGGYRLVASVPFRYQPRT